MKFLVNLMEQMDILKQSLSNAPVIWKGDYPYFIHPITDGVPRLNPHVLEAIIDLSCELVNWQDIDVILGIEAMGLPLLAPLSVRTGIPMVIARKRQYGLEGEIEISQETGYSKGSLFLNDIKPGEKIAIIDDVLSTGGTMKCVIEGIKKTGATIQNTIIVVEKGNGMERLKSDYPNIQFDSLVKLEMIGDRIVILN
ncbi:MAG TPA: purine phosphoribosyltransferase family protein [Candidatus Poseidoniales archaeon]|nr:MAG TPA: purine phosphoribosyltransferase family protein [Candidatus Poseidoniales archaeon]